MNQLGKFFLPFSSFFYFFFFDFEMDRSFSRFLPLLFFAKKSAVEEVFFPSRPDFPSTFFGHNSLTEKPNEETIEFRELKQHFFRNDLTQKKLFRTICIAHFLFALVIIPCKLIFAARIPVHPTFKSLNETIYVFKPANNNNNLLSFFLSLSLFHSQRTHSKLIFEAVFFFFCLCLSFLIISAEQLNRYVVYV